MVALPTTRETGFPNPTPACLAEVEGVLCLTKMRGIILLIGAVLPQFSGAFIGLRISPLITIFLGASGLVSVAYILTFLRRQNCVVKVYSKEIFIFIPRGPIHIERNALLAFRVNQKGNAVELATRDEVQCVETKNPHALIEAIERMS